MSNDINDRMIDDVVSGKDGGNLLCGVAAKDLPEVVGHASGVVVHGKIVEDSGHVKVACCDIVDSDVVGAVLGDSDVSFDNDV